MIHKIEHKSLCETESYKGMTDTIFLYEQVIKDKNAEIERLKENNQKLYEEMAELQKEEVAIAKRMGKTEAIKEFDERLKQEIQESKYRFNDSPYARACNQVADWCIEVGDNLVKEMTGRKEDDGK